MARPLGGWWRLWIVLAVIYGGLVATYTWMSWPDVSRVSHDPAFLKQMSPDALSVVNRPRTLAEFEQALIAADRTGATEDARKLAQDILRLQKGPQWEQDTLVLEMPNGYQFQVAGDTKPEQAKLVGREYVRVLQSIASERRFTALGIAVLIWLVPSILVCVLGLAVAWISRGFKRMGRES